MPAKKDSKPVWIAGETYRRLEEHLRGLGWLHGRTKFIEQLIDLECAGELYRLDGKSAKQRQVAEKFLFGKAGPTSFEEEIDERDQQRQSEK